MSYYSIASDNNQIAAGGVVVQNPLRFVKLLVKNAPTIQLDGYKGC
jgi:hypothetical protein